MRTLLLLPTWMWLLLFTAIPAGLLVLIALGSAADGVPPYALGTGLDNFATALTDPFYRTAVAASLTVALVTSLLCLVLGYPMALAIARSRPRQRQLLMMLVILPFWTGFLLRLLAWILLLRDDGVINALLLAAGVIAAPIPMLHTAFAMYVGLVYAYLPFMILPLVARLTRADPVLEQAAADLGAGPLATFLQVTLPLSAPGIVAGLVLVFVPVTGEYVIPEILGGPGAQTMGRVIWTEFFDNHDWPLASALSVVLLVLLLAPALLVRQGERGAR